MALTDTAVRQARTTGKDYTLNDAHGLLLFVSAKGKKKWHFRFTWMGQQQRIAIAPYPEVGLKEARMRRDELRAHLANGVDPRVHLRQAEKKALAAATHTFQAVFQSWRDFKSLSLKAGRQSTLSQINRIFAKDVLPWLDTLSIFDVTPAHLLEVLRKIERRHALTTAEKVCTWFNQMFRYAMVEMGLPANPASDLDIVAVPKPPVSHNPFLRMEELAAFLRTLRNYRGFKTTRQGIQLLFLTGVRTGELHSARPEQFDLDGGLWTIPAVIVKQLQLKMRKEGKAVPPYVVPLSTQAIAIVRDLLDAQARRPAQRYLLPNRNDPKEPISENTLNGALRRMGCVGASPSPLRRGDDLSQAAAGRTPRERQARGAVVSPAAATHPPPHA